MPESWDVILVNIGKIDVILVIIVRIDIECVIVVSIGQPMTDNCKKLECDEWCQCGLFSVCHCDFACVFRCFILIV